MEEIENKLYSNNPISISNLISKIVTTVKKKHEEGLKDYLELKFLKEKLLSADPLTSEISGMAILYLIKTGILSADSILTDLLSTLDSAKCYPNLINVLGDLLYHQINTNNFYNANNTQHPFITLIKENPELANPILNKIKNLQEEYNRKDIDRLFQPFYLYSLCCSSNSSLHLLKHKIWRILLDPACIKNTSEDFYLNILRWLQIECKDDLLIVNELLTAAIPVSLLHKNFLHFEVLLLWQVNVLYNLARHKLDMWPALTCLIDVSYNKPLIAVNCILLMISKIIDICSPLHLNKLLVLCKQLIETNSTNVFCLQTVKASLLQWLASPCILTDEAYAIGNEIVSKPSNINLDHDTKGLKEISEEYKDEISTNKNIFLAVNTALLTEKIMHNDFLQSWLDELKNEAIDFKVDMFNVLCGILLEDNENTNIYIDILNILLDCIKREHSLSTKLLTLVFYKISHTRQPRFHFILLQYLPEMAILRDNIPRVVATIITISKGSENLYNVSLSLAYNVWKIDNKCYSYLEDLLVSNPPTRKKWERYVIKAYILKKLCEKKPELYGKDSLPHLSKILNDCDDENGALSCSLAIEAITILCRAGIIDIKTTWNNISLKFNKDYRFPVVKSLCMLVQEVPKLSYTDYYNDLFDNVTKKLWELIDYGDPQIAEAALLSLTSFDIEHICESLPEKYLDSGYTAHINSITGKTWIHFLIENSASKASLEFIKKLLSNEIDEYLKYVYQAKGSKEPINYNYLPSHSVVRALGEFIKTWANKWKGSIHDKLYVECLKIFSSEFSKPLPPLDWCFLQELMHDAQTKTFSIDIASHQVTLSGSARRLIENYVTASYQDPQDEDIEHVYRNLKFLARSIQPVILKPFFETTTWYAMKQYEENKPELLLNILNSMKNVLILDDVQETNKITIVQVLEGILFCTDDTYSELFHRLVKTIIFAPSDCFKKTENFGILDNEISFKKNAKIRFALAKNINIGALKWLDEVIEIWSNYFRNLDIWDDIQQVFQRHINSTDESISWLLELIGHIQAKIADRSDIPVICFYFDILILAVNVFSGYLSFLENKHNNYVSHKDIFPQSLSTLLERFFWETCSLQILEWLYHMNMEKTVPKNYRRIFGLCLQSLKHNEEFLKNQRWVKYLNSSTIFYF